MTGIMRCVHKHEPKTWRMQGYQLIFLSAIVGTGDTSASESHSLWQDSSTGHCPRALLRFAIYGRIGWFTW